MGRAVNIICAMCLIFIAGAHSAAGSPPLPLHTVEGYGGVAITGSAYLVNPAEGGKYFGLPSIGGGSVYTPRGRYFGFVTVTETLWDRIELGYGYNVLNLHDLQRDIAAATGVVIADDRVFMHNFNARLALTKENQFDLQWLPAVTFGFHYKITEELSDIDANIGGALTQAGIEDDKGYDFTLYASKLIKKLPRPLLVNVGVRNWVNYLS